MKTSIIPIFIPHIGCPYRCIFCNQWRITGHSGIPDATEVASVIRQYTEGVSEPRHWEVAFYGGSFTAIPEELQEALLQPAYEALKQRRIAAIRCSTRPDCITIPILARLRAYDVSIVELGVQSMDDAVLAQAKRGHTAAHVVEATALLKQGGFTVGHQLMPGLPGEDWQSLERTVQAVQSLQPHMVRIYPIVVIKDTELAERYQRGDYEPLSVHEGVRRAAYMKQAFAEQGIPCIRTGLQATADLDDPTQVLAGAYAPAMGEMVDTMRYRIQLFRLLDQYPATAVTITYHRQDTSRTRGIRNVTVHRAGLRYSHCLFDWQEDNSLAPGVIGVAVAGYPKRWIHMDAGIVTSV